MASLSSNKLTMFNDMLTILYSYYSSYNDLLDRNQPLATALLLEPDKMFPLFDEAVLAAQRHIMPQHPLSNSMTLKTNCHSRIHPVPICPEITRDNVTSIRASDYGNYNLYIADTYRHVVKFH